MKLRPADLSLPLPQRLGAWLRELRIDAELSAMEMARRCNTHRPIVCRWESGRHVPSLETLHVIARVLDLDLAVLCVVLDDDWCQSARAVERRQLIREAAERARRAA